MFQLVVSKRFKKNLRDFLRKHPELEPILKEKLVILQKNPKDLRLKTHKLTGKLNKCFAIWLTYEYRLVFCSEKNLIFLLAIGTHDEVY